MSSSVRLLSLSIIALWKLPAITAAAVPATSERYCRQFCPPKKQIKHFFPNDDARYQNRRKKRLHDRHVRGEDESSHLQNALAGYNTDPYHRKGLPTLTMQSNYPASSEYVQPINNQEHP